MANGDIVVKVFRKKVGKGQSESIAKEADALFDPSNFEIIGLHPVNLTGSANTITSNYLIIARDIS